MPVPAEPPPDLTDATDVPVESRPQEAAASTELEIAAVASYVTAPIRGATNPFGAGFGARAGVAYAGWYLGASIVDYLGGSDVDVQYRALLYGIEVGYGLRWPAFGGAEWILRPRVGLGYASVYYTDPSLLADVVTSASSGASDTLTVNNPYVEPAVVVQLGSGTTFVAAEGCVLVLPGIAYGGADATTWVSYGGRLELGLRY